MGCLWSKSYDLIAQGDNFVLFQAKCALVTFKRCKISSSAGDSDDSFGSSHLGHGDFCKAAAETVMREKQAIGGWLDGK